MSAHTPGAARTRKQTTPTRKRRRRQKHPGSDRLGAEKYRHECFAGGKENKVFRVVLFCDRKLFAVDVRVSIMTTAFSLV